jgi:hypothetical protein
MSVSSHVVALAVSLFRRPTDSLRYVVLCRAFAFASAIHLTLQDALVWDWLVPNVLYWIGLVLLVWRGSVAGWLLSVLGLVGPLLFLGDQLTQSGLLLVYAVAALCFGFGRSRGERMKTHLPDTVAWLTTATYAIAAFHKLNSGFFDPEVSCASVGMDVLGQNWSIPALGTKSLAWLWPFVFIGVETAVTVLLRVRTLAGIALALATHIPLTIVFAPSFAFTMIVGWVCLFDERQLHRLADVLIERYKLILPLGTLLGLASFALYMRDHWVVYVDWSFKEVLLWIGLVWALAALPRFPTAMPVLRPSKVGWALVAIWVAHGLVVYTGLEFHHTGAMLSNLRVDHGCWNHYLVPESARVVEPYVRVEALESHGDEALVHTLETTLWNRRSLAWFAEERCGAGLPLVRATYDDRTVDVDLCRDAWPFGEPFLSGARTHQDNLERRCPQRCIH